ncbi:hypothetical protein [Mucilaginibacter polytrichastri]|uniref:Uncharacterized protein n=1 Tax=Mucilaginibacter polytrichastri TaxID=1302689 RepID=A0A1Q5ZY49_9SPHI|nr:hypothetical protein [Mucilaginibacter polytrichastri]OKS86686.1 hypothetical protein RG47T_2143 [Mucilaginibacter polytrichastri]SFS82151.1 hypothetical protein SAMN04487890_104251 [Mucilaginibacter polytrichastri]
MDQKKNELLDFVVKAHGGIEKWEQFNNVTLQLKIGGETWKIKGQENILSDVTFTANTKFQYANYYPVFGPEIRSVFEYQRVALEDRAGKLIEELLDPRASILNHLAGTWSKLEAIYFASYAAWTYFTSPFIFTYPGFVTNEIEPWIEGDETWRRLEVFFPDHIETHNKRQVFYYDAAGHLRRHDYWADVFGKTPTAHYVFDYREFMGIKLPTKRKVYSQDGQNGFKPEPVWIDIEVTDVKFS